MDIRVLDSIDQCDAGAWDALFNSDYPFLQHRFLSLLERSGSACANTGWHPQHLLLNEGEVTVAALPLYRKTHSRGEYVFDWGWAEAYRGHRLDYYPKLLSAVPFTPAAGPRLGLLPGISLSEISPLLLTTIQQLADQQRASGWHLLFPPAELSKSMKTAGAMLRSGIQYLWNNSDYRDFADFTDTFPSRKRKNIHRERRVCNGGGLFVERLTGTQISADWWEFFFVLYHSTYIKHSGNSGYLTQAFFHQLGQIMSDQVMMAVATEGQEKVAAALFFHDRENLYGRYWGCTREYDFLHFELCYYQGIEFAIERGLSRFDAGAQGEHKIKRGFEPTENCSVHWIRHPDFATAIGRFLKEERQYVLNYIQEARRQLPYKTTDQ
ncbi:GNAT family N-acetyltransferase [Porticoccus sp.]|uniref:GNAT family N-acetyltransferase n=1 Tax=Porticoccus sp. TaxID=2024853 RepID=UPI003F69B6BA